MSVIQKIRDKYATLAITVIAIAMVGFILIDALSSRTGGGMFGKNSTTVGMVDGQKIDYTEFDNLIHQTETSYEAQGYVLNAAKREDINNELWQQLVQQYVMRAQLDKLGLTFTAKELDNVLYGNNGANAPQALRQRYTDPRTGEYQVSQLQNDIRTLHRRPANDPDRVQMEEFLNNEVIFKSTMYKYMVMLAGAAYYPKWLAEKENADNSASAGVSYTNVPYSSIPDASIPVSDEEVSAYVQAHQAQYTTKDPSRTVNYVLIDGSPSSRDSAAALQQLVSLKQGFVDAKDPGAYVNQNGTSIEYSDKFRAKSGIHDAHSDSVTNLAMGAVYGPYIDGDNYVLARISDRKDIPDSVKCRHILIATNQGAIPDSVALRRIDSIQEAIQHGADFGKLAAQLSDDPGSKDKGGEYTFAYTQAYPDNPKDQGLDKAFADFIFSGKKGEIKVVKSSFGYHLIQILDQISIEPYLKIAYMGKEILPSDETTNLANAKATQFAADAEGGSPFAKVAAAHHLTLRTATLRPTDYVVLGIGEARPMVQWVFQNKIGSVSDPQNFRYEFVVSTVTGIQDAGLPTGAAARALVESAIRTEKKGKQIADKMGTPTDLQAVATKFAVVIQKADSVNFVQPYLGSQGNEPKVVGAAFNKANLHKVSAPIPGAEGVFVLRTDNVTSLANQNNDYKLARIQQEGQMRNAIGYKAMEALQNAADVSDNRIKFY